MTLPLYPTDEMVAAAWIGTIPGLSRNMVDEVLPSDDASWVNAGFVTVTTVGGGPDDSQPIYKPVIQVDVWATKPGSNKPPWRKAFAISSAIVRATWDRNNIGRPLSIAENGVVYPTAAVKTAYVTAVFRRMYDDAADYAHLQGDLALEWVVVNDRLA